MANHANNSARLGFEADLWRAADALRANMDAAEYKISIRGQESNHTTWRRAKMNLAIRGIDAGLGQGGSR